MGRDKANVTIAGVPLLELMLRKLRRLALRTCVAGMRKPVDGIDAELWSDLHPDCGPLSGMETALSRSEAPLLLVLGVDLPLIDIGFLEWMSQRAQTTGAMATIPQVAGEPQPLCAVYRTELLVSVVHALKIGDYKVMTAVNKAAIENTLDLFGVEQVAATGAWDSSLPVHCQFMNCNTREDVAAAEAHLERAPLL